MMSYPVAFLRAAHYTLEREGVFAHLKNDSGGATLYGVASNSWPSWYRRIADAERSARGAGRYVALEFYYAEIWARMGLGEIERQWVAAEVFDSATHFGRGWSARFAQHTINLCARSNGSVAPVKVDGAFGPVTRAALNACARRDYLNTLAWLQGWQGWRYAKLYELNPEKYGGFMWGWGKRMALPAEAWEPLGGLPGWMGALAA